MHWTMQYFVASKYTVLPPPQITSSQKAWGDLDLAAEFSCSALLELTRGFNHVFPSTFTYVVVLVQWRPKPMRFDELHTSQG